MSERQGIYGKYIITRSDGRAIDPEACMFVLRLDTDPAARRAMTQYARSCRKVNEDLANDIEKCIAELETLPCGCREAHCPHERVFSDVWRYGEPPDTAGERGEG